MYGSLLWSVKALAALLLVGPAFASEPLLPPWERPLITHAGVGATYLVGRNVSVEVPAGAVPPGTPIMLWERADLSGLPDWAKPLTTGVTLRIDHPDGDDVYATLVFHRVEVPEPPLRTLFFKARQGDPRDACRGCLCTHVGWTDEMIAGLHTDGDSLRAKVHLYDSPMAFVVTERPERNVPVVHIGLPRR